MSAHLVVALAAALLSATPAAPAPGANRAAAKALVAEGNKLFEAKKLDLALGKYEAAYAAYPSAKLYFNLGEVHRALGHASRAAECYQRFLDEASPDPAAETSVHAAKSLAELDQGLARVVILAAPAGAKTTIDGAPIDPPKSGARVAPGVHRVEVTAPSRDPYVKEITAAAGASIEVTFPPPPPPKLVAPAPPPAQVSLVAAPVEEDDAITTKWWFWTAVGVGAVAIAGAVVLATRGGGAYEPGGELGLTSTDQWRPLP